MTAVSVPLGRRRDAGPAPVEGPLVDTFGRVASDLRVSVIDRCNFRCTYCMPAEGLPWLAREETLTAEEIERLVRTFVNLGVGEVKLTGGEPTVRPELPEIVRRIRALGDDLEISITTNGYLLNRVVIRGTNEEEVVDFARLARQTGHQVRFIEYMPLDADRAWERSKVVPSHEIFERISAAFPLLPANGHAPQPATVFRFADGAPGTVGFISSVTEPFCDTCNRIRITADGQLRVCLFAMEETDLREPLRAGASDERMEKLIREAVWNKWSGHRINHADFARPARSMSMIGG